MRRLIILRPEPGASASLERAKALGLDAMAIPLFKVQPVAWTPPDPDNFDAVLATSANAMRYGGPGLDRFRHLSLHAVGEATAEAARETGFAQVSAGGSNVEALLNSLPAELGLFHPCGRDRRDLSGARQTITSVPVYAAEALPMPEGIAVVADAVIAVHSPRAGSRLAELIHSNDRSSVRIAAISAAAAAATGMGWAEVNSAAEPSDRALLELAARLCEKPSP